MALPATYRPNPENPDAPRVLIRSDAAGATHDFAAACRAENVGFSLGCAITGGVQAAVKSLNDADA